MPLEPECKHWQAQLRPNDLKTDGAWCPSCKQHIPLYEWWNMHQERITLHDRRIGDFIEVNQRITGILETNQKTIKALITRIERLERLINGLYHKNV